MSEPLTAECGVCHGSGERAGLLGDAVPCGTCKTTGRVPWPASTSEVQHLRAQLADALAQVALWQARALSAEHVAGIRRLTPPETAQGVTALLGDDCGRCARCLDAAWKPEPWHSWWERMTPPSGRFMVVCAVCGNKRCPHADDHAHTCTGSNEPGQPGSRYARSTLMDLVADLPMPTAPRGGIEWGKVTPVPGGIKVTGTLPAHPAARDDLPIGYSLPADRPPPLVVDYGMKAYRFGDLPAPAVTVPGLFGVNMAVDDTLPPETIEFRDGDGRVLHTITLPAEPEGDHP